MRLLQLSESEARFAVRRFENGSDAMRTRLEKIGATFIGGYNAMLKGGDIAAAMAHTDTVSIGLRGFAVEGAAMGATIVDALCLRPRHLAAWLAWADGRYGYLATVGAGWAMARVPWRRRAILAVLDPMHFWLAYDGLGFHDAFFRTARVRSGWRRECSGYAARAYDQGIGRGLWFVFCGDPVRAAGWIDGVPAARRADLWSGLGLAACYAGGEGAAYVLGAAADFRADAAQGAAFGAEAHACAGHVPASCSDSLRAMLGREVAEISAMVRRHRADLRNTHGASAELPAYEQWRLAVRKSLGN